MHADVRSNGSDRLAVQSRDLETYLHACSARQCMHASTMKKVVSQRFTEGASADYVRWFVTSQTLYAPRRSTCSGKGLSTETIREFTRRRTSWNSR